MHAFEPVSGESLHLALGVTAARALAAWRKACVPRKVTLVCSPTGLHLCPHCTKCRSRHQRSLLHVRRHGPLQLPRPEQHPA